MNESFENYRRLMFSIAYRMLGSVMEAEDVVQEAYLRYQAVSSVQAPKAFLSTVTTRLCLDQLKSAQARRETYIGPWLPEPLLTASTPLPEPAKEAEVAESISLAFMVLLESLTPVERAVFLLREVFDYEYTEIAEIVGKKETACRQLFSRAKQHIAQHRPRFKSTPEEHQRLLASFLQATSTGDVAALANLLAEDVVVWADGGGKVQAATRQVKGRDSVTRFLIGIQRFRVEGMQLEIAEINGAMGVILRYADGRPYYVITLEINDGHIQTIRNIGNPDKIKHL